MACTVQAAAAGADDTPLTVQPVKTGLYLIGGGGANSVLRFSASGSLLVDGKLPGQYRALMSQIRRLSKLSDLPLRLVVVTDHQPQHSGNDAQFLAARVPVIAQQNAARHRPPEAAELQALRGSFDDERLLQFGGVQARLLHLGPAQSDDAALVHFADLKVVAIGDLFTPQAPQPDYGAGGSLPGWSKALARLLQLDFDTAIPSLGPPVGRAELQAFKDRIDRIVARADALLRQGATKAQFLAQWPADDDGLPAAWIDEHFEALRADLAPPPR